MTATLSTVFIFIVYLLHSGERRNIETEEFRPTTRSTSCSREGTNLLRRVLSQSAGNISEVNRGKNGSETQGLNVTLDDDDDWSDLTFEEKKREDGYNRTTPEENPYSLLLVIKYWSGDEGVCTGSLLTDVWVLTAAHCVVNARHFIVYAGGDSLEEVKSNRLRNGSQLLTTDEYYAHPMYQNNSFSYDVAVVKTTERFNLTATVNTVQLSVQPWTYKSYKQCKFTGFGMVNIKQKHAEDKTRKTHLLNVKRPCLCSFKLRMLLGRSSVQTYLCSQPVEDYGVCPGDSGGGLICDGSLRGVAMQLIQLLSTQTCELSLFDAVRCGGPTTLSIFQNTCFFVRWINSHVRLFNESVISPECREPRGAAVPSVHLPPHLIVVMASAATPLLVFIS